MKNRSTPLIFCLLALLVLAVSGCSSTANELPTATLAPTLPAATETPLPTASPIPTATPLPSPTPTAEPTATATLIPFRGFLENFRFYRAWQDGEQTVFYFLNADLEYPLYVLTDDNELLCDRDPDYPISMVCKTQNGRMDYEKKHSFAFYADAEHAQLVHEMNVEPPAALATRYSNTFDCPQRGQNVYCETEYRLYSSGYCSTSISCSDACGYWYSQDNLPSSPDDPWVPVGSCN